MIDLKSRNGAGPVPAIRCIHVTLDQRHADVIVDAPLLEPRGLAQLSELLEWLVSAGSTSVRVDLGGLGTVDADLLLILREAHDRLDGELITTTQRSEVRRMLSVVGLATLSAAPMPRLPRWLERRSAHAR